MGSSVSVVRQGPRDDSVNSSRDLGYSRNREMSGRISPERRRRDREDQRYGEKSPRRDERQRSPRRGDRERSPRRYDRERSPRRYERERSPRRNERERSPRRNERERSPRRNERERSPRRNERDGQKTKPENAEKGDNESKDQDGLVDFYLNLCFILDFRKILLNFLKILRYNVLMNKQIY